MVHSLKCKKYNIYSVQITRSSLRGFLLWLITLSSSWDTCERQIKTRIYKNQCSRQQNNLTFILYFGPNSPESIVSFVRPALPRKQSRLSNSHPNQRWVEICGHRWNCRSCDTKWPKKTFSYGQIWTEIQRKHFKMTLCIVKSELLGPIKMWKPGKAKPVNYFRAIHVWGKPEAPSLVRMELVGQCSKRANTCKMGKKTLTRLNFCCNMVSSSKVMHLPIN